MRKRWDVFFSLHSDGVKEPLYISEVVEKSMVSDFGAVVGDGQGADGLRSERAESRFPGL